MAGASRSSASPSADVEQSTARGRPAEHGRHERLRPWIDDLDDTAVASHRVRHGLEGAADRLGLPAPRRPHRRGGECLKGQQRGCFSSEHPGGGVVGGGQAIETRARRRLPDDQAYPRRRPSPADRVGAVANSQNPGGCREPEHGVGVSFAEGVQVLAQTGLDRTHGPVEPLDEATDRPKRVLECQPGVALSECRPAREPDMAARHPDERSRPGAVASRLDGRIASRRDEPQRGQHGCLSKIGLDPLEDRRQGDELARRVKGHHLVDQRPGARDLGKPLTDRRARLVGVTDCRGTFQVVGFERRLAQLSTAELVPADRTAVVPEDGMSLGRDGRLRGRPCRGSGLADPGPPRIQGSSVAGSPIAA